MHLLRRRRLVLLFASSVLCLRFIHGLWLLSTPSRGSWNAPTSPSFPLCDSPSGCTASCNSDTDGCSPRAPSNTTNKSILSPISVLWYLEIARTGIQFQIRLIHRLVTQRAQGLVLVARFTAHRTRVRHISTNNDWVHSTSKSGVTLHRSTLLTPTKWPKMNTLQRELITTELASFLFLNSRYF